MVVIDMCGYVTPSPRKLSDTLTNINIVVFILHPGSETDFGSYIIDYNVLANDLHCLFIENWD